MGGRASTHLPSALPDSATAFAQDGSGDALAVTDLSASSSNLPGGGNYGLLDGEGEDLLGVGGTLNVPSSATPGQYVARIVVVVSYS